MKLRKTFSDPAKDLEIRNKTKHKFFSEKGLCSIYRMNVMGINSDLPVYDLIAKDFAPYNA
jgi:hypothetical protein